MELEDAVNDQIQRHCAKGDDSAKQALYPDALKEYWAAWDLLPEPKTQWEAATWILAAVGDANYLSGDFVAGRDNLSHAMHCPDAIGNPFLHLRLGQCQFEVGNLDRAADELGTLSFTRPRERGVRCHFQNCHFFFGTLIPSARV